MVRVINGDCHKEIENVINGVRNPVIVTDPPFNIGYHYDKYDDNISEGEYYDSLSKIFKLCPSVVIHYPESLYYLAMKLGRVPDRVISWVYNSNTPKQHRDVVYFGIRPDFRGLGEYKNPTDKRVSALIAQGKKPIGYDWIYCDQVKNVSSEKIGHPCQMPLEVMLYVLRTLPRESTVIDPFAGSGTTLLAAKRIGMDAIGIEISEQYCMMMERRLEWDSPLFDAENMNV